MQSDSIILIPTYNERENVSKMIEQVLALPKEFDILIIDDGSPDGTASIVKEQQKIFPNRVFLIERQGKLGLGTAYITGFQWALERAYLYIFEMDCDFSHPIIKLQELYKAVAQEGADVSIGSRYCKGGKIENWPIGRILMSYGASLYVRMITAIRVKDTTAGFVCYRREVLEAMDLEAIRFKGYAFQIEMKYSAHCLGYKLSEVPITFTDRLLGQSKMSTSIFGEAFFGVLQLRWDKFRGLFPRGKYKERR